MMEDKKVRAPNFTQQECHLLAELMGEKLDDVNMSRHKLDKHRFTDKITSHTKKRMWRDVETKFNALNGVRKACDLQKKWENLVSKHRAIYSDYLRDLNMTGSGPFMSKYSLLTETIISVIGKECVAVCGVGGIMLDSTINKLKKTSEKPSIIEVPVGYCSMTKRNLEPSKRVDVSSEKSECCVQSHCHCDLELVRLKKRKLELQIAFYEKELKINKIQ